MVDVLKCCPLQSINEPYIGVDERCQQTAIFCIQHNPHKNSQGLMHQMLPLKHFKKTLMQKKFLMNSKISTLIDQYNNLMDSLIQQIHQLKLRKNIQLNMLWLRQLAKNQQQYQLMRQVYRMDFTNLTCSLIHSIYFKIVHNQILEKKTLSEIDCYKGIVDIIGKLSQEKQTRKFLAKKVSEIEGMLENGEILKRALPDKAVFKQNIKQVLLDSPHIEFTDLKYNTCKLIKGSRQYLSIFSKYPIVPYVLYHINFQTKYTNVMLGICTETLVMASKGQQSLNQSQSQDENLTFSSVDKHYSKQSIVFNCTNGCVYKDGMFESGGSALSKGQKELVLKMRLTSTNELLIMLGKNILCRQKVDSLLQRNHGQITKLYLHVLLRTQGDSFEVNRDKDITGDQLPPQIIPLTTEKKEDFQILTFNPSVNFDEIKKRNQQQVINVNQLMEEIVSQKAKNSTENNQNGSESSFIDLSHLNSNKNLKSFKVLTDDRKSRKSIIKETKNIQQRKQLSYASDDHPNVHFKKLSQSQKDTKINDIIKKERIDKILNQIKSKPLTNINEDAGNSFASRKIRQFQQRKNSNQSLNVNAMNRIKQIRNKIQLEQSEAKQRNLRPIGTIGSWDSSALINSMSSYQKSEQNINNTQRSSDLKPLLITQKPEQKSSPRFPSTSQYKIISPPLPNINTSNHQEQYKYIGKIRPQQRISNPKQFDSPSNDNTIFDQSYLATMTPINKFKEQQSKSVHINGIDDLGRKLYHLPTLRQSEQNLDQSGAFNDRVQQESQVIESFDTYFLPNTPQQVLGDQKTMIPKLNQSQFQKIEQKTLLNQSYIGSSFGRQNTMKNKPVKLMESQNKSKKTSIAKPQLQNSIIDLGSQFRSDFSSSNSIHIGNIISPRQPKRTYTEFSQTFNMNQLDEQQSQSVISIGDRLV